MKLREWNARLHGLVVFRSLLDDPVVAKFVDLTNRMEAGAPGYGPVCDAVAQFEAALFEHTTNWGSYLSAAVLEAETVCVRQAASGTLAPALQTALDSELAFLQALCGLTLDELLASSDVITLHCPLTEKTQGLIGSEAIARMKDGVRVINTARGPLVNEGAMAEALLCGKVACYMADVLSAEPPSPDNPLLSAPNTILTPHVAWAPRQTRARLEEIAVGNVRAFLEGAPRNVVSL